MFTTTVFAELMVIGFQSLVWISLFVLSFWGIERVLKILHILEEYSLAFSLAFLSFTYTIGVIVERLALACCALLSFKKAFMRIDRLVNTMYEGAEKYHLEVIAQEGRAVEKLEFNRIRIRIIRGTVFNVLLTIVALVVFVNKRVPAVNKGNLEHLAFVIGFLAFVVLNSFLNLLEISYDIDLQLLKKYINKQNHKTLHFMRFE